MAKKFIVVTQDVPQGTRDAISTYLQAKGYGYWHWFNEVWLLTNVVDSTTCQGLYNELVKALNLGLIWIMILEAPSGQPDYFGCGNKEGWPWMAENWGKAKPVANVNPPTA